VKKFLSDNKITCLEWPGNSLGLNPIENLWAICKDRLKKLDCTTDEKIICAVIKVWVHDTEIKETCKKLVDAVLKGLNLF
jgi:transposase